MLEFCLSIFIESNFTCLTAICQCTIVLDRVPPLIENSAASRIAINTIFFIEKLPWVTAV
jgi:hypothetical protein